MAAMTTTAITTTAIAATVPIKPPSCLAAVDVSGVSVVSVVPGVTEVNVPPSLVLVSVSMPTEDEVGVAVIVSGVSAVVSG